MSSSATSFPARFAELVYLLANQPAAAEAQQRALGAAMAALGGDGASLTTSQLNVDLLDEGDSVDGLRLHELVTRMSTHSAYQIDLLGATPADEMLGLARILAGDATPKDDGAAFDEQLVRLAPTSIEVHLGRSGFVRSGSKTPPMSASVDQPSVRVPTPFRGLPSVGTPPRSAPSVRTPAPARSVRATPAHSHALTPSGTGTSASGVATPASPPTASRIRDESTRIIEGAITAKMRAFVTDDDLIERLETGIPREGALRTIDELATIAESRAQEQRWEPVTYVLDAFVRGEAEAEHDAERRRAFTLAIRRLTKPSTLRGVAGLLPRRPELRDAIHEIMLRLGPEGAEALIELLTGADVLTDRRAYLAALVKCRDAVPTLIHLLGDNRWYVVRNAADLLGEMRPPEAENALIEVASHREERVRRSAATALARLGTPRAVQAAQQMLRDVVPEVRVHAAQGLGSTRWPRAASVLSRALDGEKDTEVQAVILAALGHLATDEAVARLVKAAEPEGRLFKRKPTALRVSAVQALAEASTPEAQTALRRFADDKDRDVRDAAARALRPKTEG